jgi:hypothetical protein
MPLPPYAGATAAASGAVTDTCNAQQQYSQHYNQQYSQQYGQQYSSQYALPYDLAKQRLGSSYGQQQQQQPAAAPPWQQASAGLQLQPSSSLAGSRSPSSSMYVRQPSWVGSQPAVAAAAPVTSPTGAAGVDGRSGYGNQGAQQTQQQQQQGQQLSRPPASQWSRSSRGWGSAVLTAAAAAGASSTPSTAQAASDSSSQGPASVKQTDSEEYPSLCKVYASIVRSSEAQTPTRDPKQKQEQQQQQQPKQSEVQQQQQQQQHGSAHKAPLSPFAACQAIAEEGELQNSAPAVPVSVGVQPHYASSMELVALVFFR